jgi:hypothetical protein
MANILAALVWIAKNLPSVISVIMQIIALIGSLKASQREEVHSELKEAYKALKQGDAGPLNAIHDKIAQRIKNAEN